MVVGELQLKNSIVVWRGHDNSRLIAAAVIKEPLQQICRVQPHTVHDHHVGAPSSK